MTPMKAKSELTRQLSGLSVTPISGASITAALRDRIREAILTGQVAPGTRLRQTDLTEAFGVSLTPVREALRELTAEGLLDESPYVGISVHEPTLEEFEQINEIKLDLTPLAVREAVKHATSAQLHQARALIAQMDEQLPGAGWVVLNRQFHHVLDSATANDHLAQILRRLDNLAALYVNISLDARDSLHPTANDEHKAIVAAFEERNVDEAIALTRRHIVGTLQAARSTFETNRDGRA